MRPSKSIEGCLPRWHFSILELINFGHVVWKYLFTRSFTSFRWGCMPWTQKFSRTMSYSCDVGVMRRELSCFFAHQLFENHFTTCTHTCYQISFNKVVHSNLTKIQWSVSSLCRASVSFVFLVFLSTLLCFQVGQNWCILARAVSSFCIILFVSSRLNNVEIPLLMFCDLRRLYI